MESVLRAVVIYLFILILFRMSGKRTLAQLTTFDFILLLIVGEATQQALLRNDFSVINAFLVIATLISMDVLFAFFSRKNRLFDKLTNGVPVIVLENGELIRDRMQKERLEVDDILEAARRHHGLEKLDQVKYAVLEKDGQISIVPNDRNI